MNAGRIEQVGPPTEVYRRPASLFVASFIGSPAMNLLPGKVIADGVLDVGACRILFDAQYMTAHTGQAVDVGIRPEDAEIAGSVPANDIPFMREFVEELGATRLVHGTIGTAPFVVAVQAAAPVAAEKGTNLAIAPAAVHLFDTQTGLSLRKP
jgi:sn-glycerol 3-phosphate transport system ATP-binding protein